MKAFALICGLVAAAAAHAGHAARGHMLGTAPAYSTVVSTVYVTYCPEPTNFEYNSKTYSVTEATTLTITDCPDNVCTWVVPVYTTTSVHCSGGETCHPTSVIYGNNTAPSSHTTASMISVPSGCPGPDCHVPTGGGEEVPVVAGAGRIASLSGIALAGVLAIAAAL